MDKSFEGNDVLFYARCLLVRYSIDDEMCVSTKCEKEKRRIRTKKKEKSLRLVFIFYRGFYSCCWCYGRSYLSLVLHLGIIDWDIIQCSLFDRKLHWYLRIAIDNIANVIA